MLHLLIEHLPQIIRNASDAEALNHEAVIMRKEVFDQLGPGAGNQLQDHDAVVQPVSEANRFRERQLGNKADDPAIPDHGQRGEVDTAEGVVAVGIGLLCSRSRNDVPVEDQDHTHGGIVRGIADAVKQIESCIRAVLADRLLRAGDHDRLVGILNHIG